MAIDPLQTKMANTIMESILNLNKVGIRHRAVELCLMAWRIMIPYLENTKRLIKVPCFVE